MSQTRPNPQHSDSDHQRSTRKNQPSQGGWLPEYVGGLTARQRSVLQLQRTVGNAAVQRLLAATNSPTIQRNPLPGMEDLNAPTTAAPVDPAPAPDGGEERLTSQEWLGRVENPQIIMQSPMIGFSVGDTFAGFPTSDVQTFDLSGPAPA